MDPIITPCDVGRWVSMHFRAATGHFRAPVSGVLTVVRWQRDAEGGLHVLITLEVGPQDLRHFEVDRSMLSRITVNGSDRSVGP